MQHAPTFTLQDARRGWGHVRAPFDLAVAVRVGGERRRVSVSLEFLLELYGHVRHGRPCHLVAGSGTVIELEEWGTDVRFRVNYSWTAQTTFTALQRELEAVLAETFGLYDRLAAAGAEPATRRSGSLETLDRHVADRDVGYDVGALYERLAPEPG